MPRKTRRPGPRSAHASTEFKAGDLHLNVETRQLIKNGNVHRLTPKLCALLKTFIIHRGKVLSRQFIMKEVWETDYIDDTRTLEVHVCLLRKHIEDDRKQPTYVRTVHGVGYRFDSED
jgi:DNA-binding response OmpR family regulator